MKTIKNFLFFISFITIIIFSCNKKQVTTKLPDYDKPTLPSQTFNYENNLSGPLQSFFSVQNSNVQFRNLNEVITLGRVIFYDKLVSINNTVSCGSCHHQENAFADNVQFSKGDLNTETKRNAPGITNVAFQHDYFWDHRESNLYSMVTKPIQNHIEMGMEDLNVLCKKLSHVSYYPTLFKKAYGDEYIVTDRISFALAEFLKANISYRSKFDESVKSNFSSSPYGGGGGKITNIAGLSSDENKGWQLFQKNCDACHGGITSQFGQDGGWTKSNTAEMNIGLKKFPADADLNMVKVPNLRNVEYTAPYMHDGRFKTLDDVVNHYSEGVEMNPDLSSPIITNTYIDANGNRGFHFDNYEKKCLIAFLKTLSDNAFVNDVRFSDPFKK